MKLRLLGVSLLLTSLTLAGCTGRAQEQVPVSAQGQVGQAETLPSPEVGPGLTQVQADQLLGSLKNSRQQEPGASQWRISAGPWQGTVQSLGEVEGREVMLVHLTSEGAPAEYGLVIWTEEGQFHLQPLLAQGDEVRTLAEQGHRLASGGGNLELATVFTGGGPWMELWRLNPRLNLWVRVWAPYRDQWLSGGSFAWRGEGLTSFNVTGLHKEPVPAGLLAEPPLLEQEDRYERQDTGYVRVESRPKASPTRTLVGFLNALKSDQGDGWVTDPGLIAQAKALGLHRPPAGGWPWRQTAEGIQLGGKVLVRFTEQNGRPLVRALEAKP